MSAIDRIVLRGHDCGATALVLIAEKEGSEVVVSGDENGQLLIWELAQRRPLQSVRGHSAGIKTVRQLTQGGKRLILSEGRDGWIRAWDLQNKNELVLKKEFPTFCHTFCRMALNSGLLASGTDDSEEVVVWNSAKLWQNQAQQLNQADMENCEVWKVKMSEKWGESAGMLMAQELFEVKTSLVFLALAFENGKVYLLDVSSRSFRTSINLSADVLLCLNISRYVKQKKSRPDSTRSRFRGLAAGASGEIFPFSLEFSFSTMQQDLSLKEQDTKKVMHPFAQAAAQARVVESHQTTIKATKADHGVQVLSTGVGQMCVSADQKLLAVASWDHKVYLFRFKDLKLLRALDQHKGSVSALTWFATRSRLISASRDANLVVWDLETR